MRACVYVSDVSLDRFEPVIVSGGDDGVVKIWDLRQFHKCVCVCACACVCACTSFYNPRICIIRFVCTHNMHANIDIHVLQHIGYMFMYKYCTEVLVRIMYIHMYVRMLPGTITCISHFSHEQWHHIGHFQTPQWTNHFGRMASY